jgi:hypothetical protein
MLNETISCFFFYSSSCDPLTSATLSAKKKNVNPHGIRVSPNSILSSKVVIDHCKKRHLRSVPFLEQFRLFTENSGKELNVKESSLKSSEKVFP